MKNLIQFSVLSSMLALCACGSLTHKKDDVALAGVKKIAVVAFTADEPASAQLSFSLNSHSTQAARGGSLIPQHSDNVNKMLAELQADFAKNMQWSVLDTKTMLANEGYKTAYHKTMDGWQSKMPPNAGRNRFIIENVMDFDGPRILDRPGRDQLISDLGVDAIVTTYVNVYLNGTSIMGIGSRHPQSNVSFTMYIRGRDEPVWFEGQIKGDEAKESVGSTGFTDEDATSKLALESAKTAFSRIGKTE